MSPPAASAQTALGSLGAVPDTGAVPRHVAIIMDGNGRWAKRRLLPRFAGHKAGVDAVRRIARAARAQGIEALTLYSFSSENWRRPETEISDLMGLIKLYVTSDLDRLERDGVRLKILGRKDGISSDIQEIITRAEKKTAHNTRLLLQVAFNYGGRADLVDGVKHLVALAVEGRLGPDDVTEARLGQALSTSDSPPVDLIIRSSGEQRLSNFLLWEAAYAEFVYQDVLWPDYGREPLMMALKEFQGRARRFGGVDPDDAIRTG